MNNRITIRLDDYTLGVVNELSEKHQVSKSSVVRAVLTKTIRDDIVDNNGYIKKNYSPGEK